MTVCSHCEQREEAFQYPIAHCLFPQSFKWNCFSFIPEACLYLHLIVLLSCLDACHHGKCESLQSRNERTAAREAQHRQDLGKWENLTSGNSRVGDEGGLMMEKDETDIAESWRIGTMNNMGWAQEGSSQKSTIKQGVVRQTLTWDCASRASMLRDRRAKHRWRNPAQALLVTACGVVTFPLENIQASWERKQSPVKPAERFFWQPKRGPCFIYRFIWLLWSMPYKSEHRVQNWPYVLLEDKTILLSFSSSTARNCLFHLAQFLLTIDFGRRARRLCRFSTHCRTTSWRNNLSLQSVKIYTQT